MTKKKSIKRYILWGVLALVVAGLAVMPLMARQQQAEDGPQASILSANASVRSIRTAIHGGGTLEAGDPEDITVPKDVKITEFLVKNGDFVQEGDPLAAVDKVTVMTAITEVQSSMSQVRKQMVSVSDEKAATEVSATAGGRVKLVYAKQGDRVESVMLEHGALAVLSLDSKMCVRLSVDCPLTTGEAVTVTLENGKEVTGRVESNLSGILVVTIEDKGYEVGQRASVSGAGEGILEIHSPWNATAFAGTVSIVYAQPEQTLGSGAALFTLKDTDYTAQREALAQTHREYEELLQKLFKMYDSGVIEAPCDGLVSGIDKNSAHLLAAQEEEMIAQPLSAGEGEFRIVLLSSVTPLTGCTGDSNCPLPGTDSGHQDGCLKKCTKSEGCTADTHFKDCIQACTHADSPEKCPATGLHFNDCIKACINAKNEETACPATKYHYKSCIQSCDPEKGEECSATGVHKKACIKSCVRAEAEHICDAERHYSNCIESCEISPNAGIPCSASRHKPGCYYYGAVYYATVFKVTSVGNQALIGIFDTNTYQVVNTGSKWVRVDGQPLDASLATQSGSYPTASAGQFKAGDVVLSITGKKGEESFPVGLVLYQRSMVPDFTIPKFSIPSFGGMGGYGGGTTSQTQLYDLTGDVLMTVTPQDTMTLTVAVDESDISSVKMGMSAEITVNALPEQVFEGEITKVAMSGSGNGGSSKFAVEITLPRQGEMLAGMSASAVISLYEKMNVLTLPAAALTEDGARTIVYTALDKKTGEPVNPVEVTTGLSDGQTVEILSGLKSGDQVYYAYYDTLEESDAVELDRMTVY